MPCEDREAEGGWPCDHGGRQDQELQTEEREGLLNKRLWSGEHGVQYSNFGLLVFRAVREYSSVLLSHPAHGTLLWQPYERLNTQMDNSQTVYQRTLTHKWKWPTPGSQMVTPGADSPKQPGLDY